MSRQERGIVQGRAPKTSTRSRIDSKQFWTAKQVRVYHFLKEFSDTMSKYNPTYHSYLSHTLNYWKFSPWTLSINFFVTSLFNHQRYGWSFVSGWTHVWTKTPKPLPKCGSGIQGPSGVTEQTLRVLLLASKYFDLCITRNFWLLALVIFCTITLLVTWRIHETKSNLLFASKASELRMINALVCINKHCI